MIKNVKPEAEVVFKSTQVKHSYGEAIIVSARRNNIEGSIVFGHSNDVLLAVKVFLPPNFKGFFNGIFDEMVEIAEEVVTRTYGAPPRISVRDCTNF